MRCAAGTPVQNNMRELYGILNLLDPQQFASEEEFLERFGSGGESTTAEQVRS